MKMMMMMVEAKGLIISDSNGKINKHATTECDCY